jgi:hypothetical protein
MVTIRIICLECPDCLKLETICHKLVRERQYQANILKSEQDHYEQEKEKLPGPVLLINDKAKSWGRVPEKKEIEGWVDDLLKVFFY